MRTLAKANWFLSQQLGIDLRTLLRAPWGMALYIRDLMRFRRTNALKLRLQPCLHDWWQQAGAVGTEYFWQDLVVARMIHDAAPVRHIDVGSRLDGFVAHVASFREIEVFDVRPLESTIPGVVFRQADMMSENNLGREITDSLSCLHAVEHFGLGRYGDPLNAQGSMLGIANLARLLRPGGTLYLSCPVGEDEVFFNAHRALRPNTVKTAIEGAGLRLVQCKLFNSSTKAFEVVSMDHVALAHGPQHSLGLYLCEKPESTTV